MNELEDRVDEIREKQRANLPLSDLDKGTLLAARRHGVGAVRGRAASIERIEAAKHPEPRQVDAGEVLDALTRKLDEWEA